MKSYFIQTVSLLGLISVVGCGKNLTQGHYEGTISLKNYGNNTEQPVSFDVTYDGKSHISRHHRKGNIEIKDQNDKHILSIDIYNASKDQFDLNIPEVCNEKFHLVEIPQGKNNGEVTCFLDKKSWTAELCYDSERVRLKVLDPFGTGVLKLLGDAFTKEPAFKLELPVALPLDKAVERALSANLDSRIGFEHVIQAKYAVTAAYLSLIPHLTTNLIWNAEPGYVSAIATLQGLTPFLLPTYWLQAREAQYDQKVKKDAETILQADLAAMTEQLAYAYDRDQEILNVHDRALNSLKSFLSKVGELEVLGQLPSGTVNAFGAISKKIESDKDKVQQLVQQDQYAVSQALGYHNPEAVTQIVIPPFEIPSPLHFLQKAQVADTASRRSFELRQMAYLRRIAELKGIELYFAWIDPTGDPKSSFGFNTIAQVKLSNSQIHELDLRREQLKQTIYQNTYRIVDQYNSTIEFASQVSSAAAVMEQELDTLLNNALQFGFKPEQVIAMIESYLSNRVGKVANIAEFRIAKSKVDRILLEGFYEYLFPVLSQKDFELQLPLL